MEFSKIGELQLKYHIFSNSLNNPNINYEEKINQLISFLSVIFFVEGYSFIPAERNTLNGFIGKAIKNKDFIGIYWLNEKIELGHGKWNDYIFDSCCRYSERKSLNRSILFKLKPDSLNYDSTLLDKGFSNTIELTSFRMINKKLNHLKFLDVKKSEYYDNLDFNTLSNIVQDEFMKITSSFKDKSEDFWSLFFQKTSENISKHNYKIELFYRPKVFNRELGFLRCENKITQKSYFLELNCTSVKNNKYYIHFKINYDKRLGRKLAGFHFRNNIKEFLLFIRCK